MAVALAVDVHGQGEDAQGPRDARHDAAHLHGAILEIPVDDIICQSVEWWS